MASGAGPLFLISTTALSLTEVPNLSSVFSITICASLLPPILFIRGSLRYFVVAVVTVVVVVVVVAVVVLL